MTGFLVVNIPLNEVRINAFMINVFMINVFKSSRLEVLIVLSPSESSQPMPAQSFPTQSFPTQSFPTQSFPTQSGLIQCSPLVRQTELCQSVSSVFLGLGRTPLFFQGWLPCGSLEGLVLMVHGLGSHGGTFWPWARSLVNHGFGVYALDLRGHGRSAGRQGYIEHWSHFRQDLHQFIQEVLSRHPQTPYFLFGHSLGGTILLDYLLREPVEAKGVVLMAPALSLASVSPWKRWVAQLFSRVWPKFTVGNRFPADWGTRDPSMARLMDQDTLRHSWGSARLGTEYFQAVHDIMVLAPTLNLPILVIQGKDDRIVDGQTSQLLFDRLRLQDKTRWVYPEGRHDLHLDLEREQVAADIECWMSQRRCGSLSDR